MLAPGKGVPGGLMDESSWVHLECQGYAGEEEVTKSYPGTAGTGVRTWFCGQPAWVGHVL